MINIEYKKAFLKFIFSLKKFRRKSKKNQFQSILLTAVSSIFIIGLCFSLPSTVEFLKKPEVVENLSKKQLDRVLSGENLITEDNEQNLDQRYLYEDIEFDDGPSKSVRIKASVLKQLFEDEDYELKYVRSNKTVKPFDVGMLPSEMKKIEDTKKRKDLFIKIVLPLILEENDRIKIDRKKLFKILNKNMNSDSEKKWLNSKFKQYGVLNKDLSTLKVRMDIVPVSLAIAQAAKETGWGTSRFAIEGNALFGQWTWSGEGIKPAGVDSKDAKHKVMKFKVLKASVRAYQRNLNTHGSYKKFRSERANMRDNDEELDSLLLADYLDKYAATGKEYTKILKQIIKQNNLKDFDKVKLLPTSLQLKSII